MCTTRRLMCFAVLAVGVAVVATAGASAVQPKLPKKYTETITTELGEKISFDMVLVPGGTFMMGSPPDEPGRKEDEGPRHQVCLEPFYICTTETTLELFLAYYQETVTAKKDVEAEEIEEEDLDALTGPTPVYGDLTMGYSKKNPAIGMTWLNALVFCKWLSKKTGKQYRLPTEAEWEYACRAGTTTAYFLGGRPTEDELARFAWYKANSAHEPHPVATRKPNPWGLYDMAGNVREWVYDFYSPAAYAELAKQKPAVNPRGPKTGKVHVARGGDHSSPKEELRCAARAFEQEWWRAGDPQIPKSRWWLPEMDIIGFRVARSVKSGATK